LTREAWVFQRALLASLLFHVLLLALFMTLPGGGPAVPVQIYTVRIQEAPARPEARELTLSTQAISALKLESPSLNVDKPSLPEPEQADVPDVETFPKAPRAPDALPAPRAPSLTPPQARAPSAPGPLPPAATLSSAAPALPSLPAPAPPTASQVPTRRPASRPAASAPASAPPPDDEPARPSAMEQLRSKVRQINLQVEATPATGPARPTPESQPGAERNVLSLRLYANRVREAVKEQYTFPGGFDPSLRTRVRVVLNRDGSVRSTELLESSGNERFDRLVCLGAFNKARIPPVPQGIEGDGETLTLNFTCYP